MFQNQMYEKLDVIVGVFGCIAGVVLAAVAYISGESGTLEIGIAIMVASVVYLLFKNKIADSSNPSLPESKSLNIILNIIFLSAFMASILLMQSSLYRPILYFMLTSVAVAALAAEILSSNGKTQTGWIILKTLFISFSLRYGLLYELPGFYGVDPWWHSIIVEDWLNYGHIVSQISTGHTSYADFPIMHLGVMAMRIVTQLNPKDSLFASIGLFYIFSMLFVFLLSQHLINTKAGLLAALFISFSSDHIGWGAWLVPTSLGIGIFTMILWVIFKSTFNIASRLILIIISSTLILAHTVSAFVTAIALVLILTANRISRRQYKNNGEKLDIEYAFVLFFCVFMLTRWIHCFYSPSRSFFEVEVGWLTSALSTDVQYVGTAFEASATPLGPLNRVGFLMLICFIVIGSLFWLSPKTINNRKIAIIASAGGLSTATFIFPFFGITNLIPGRWLPFVCVIAAPIVAEGILALSRLLNDPLRKSILMVLVVFIFCTFMINSVGINTQSPFYGTEYMKDPARAAFTESELSTVDTILKVYNGIITTDNEYLKLPFAGRIAANKLKLLSTDTKNEGLIIIREYVYTHGIIREQIDEQSRNLLNSFGSYEHNMIYNNGEVKAYLSRD